MRVWGWPQKEQKAQKGQSYSVFVPFVPFVAISLSLTSGVARENDRDSDACRPIRERTPPDCYRQPAARLMHPSAAVSLFGPSIEVSKHRDTKTEADEN